MLADPPLSPREVLELGWAQTSKLHPNLGYVVTPERKKPGVTRVGLFGCSMVYGVEAAPGRDIASFLQVRLRREGYGHVEVVNFAGRGYGFHQAHRLWELLGARYGLDCVVGYWMPEYVRRDETFQLHPAPINTQPHARYVLDGEGTRLVVPPGRDYEEVAALYGRLLQPWLYWRYDARAPNLLRGWWSKTANAFWNPFYYRPGDHPELWRRLTALKAARPNRVVVLGERPLAQAAELEAITRGTKAGWTLLGQLHRQKALHQAPENHASALGNRLRADELFAALTGRPTTTAVLSLLPLHPVPQRVVLPPLTDWSDGVLHARGRPVARLVRRTGSTYAAASWPAPSALVLWDQEGEPRLLPWPDAWPPRSALTLSLTAGGKRVEVALGEVVSPDGRLAHAVFNGSTWSGDGWSLSLSSGSLLEGLQLRSGEASAAGLAIAGRPALRLSGPAQKLVFEPQIGELLDLRSTEGQYADPDALGRDGEAYFASADGARKAVLARYALRDERLSPVVSGAPALGR